MTLKPLELSEMPQLRDPGGMHSQPLSQDCQMQKEPVELGRETSTLGEQAEGKGASYLEPQSTWLSRLSPPGLCCKRSHQQD